MGAIFEDGSTDDQLVVEHNSTFLWLMKETDRLR